MADLTIAGTDLRVTRDSYTEGLTVVAGDRARAFDNTLLSSERAEKRTAECQVDFLSPSDYDAFRASVPRGEGVTISGDLTRTSFTGVVDIGRAVAVFREGTDPLWACQLRIEET